MKLFVTLTLLLAIAASSAETVRVTVGNTGCRTKQLTVQRLWKTMPGVRSVVILPRKPGDPANQRIFVVTTTGPAADFGALTRSLGRRAERYPLLDVATASAAIPPSNGPARRTGSGARR